MYRPTADNYSNSATETRRATLHGCVFTAQERYDYWATRLHHTHTKYRVPYTAVTDRGRVNERWWRRWWWRRMCVVEDARRRYGAELRSHRTTATTTGRPPLPL